MLLCMLKAVEGDLCSLEAPKVCCVTLYARACGWWVQFQYFDISIAVGFSLQFPSYECCSGLFQNACPSLAVHRYLATQPTQ